MRERIFKISDYVRYAGDFSIVSGPLRQPGIGVIENFEEFNGVERVNLFLPDRNSHIWCDYPKIGPINTHPEHLLACGFVLEKVGARERYRRGHLVVSAGTLLVPQMGRMISTDYCVADFTAPVDVDKYISGDDFDLRASFRDHHWVNNLNDLFDLLKSLHIQLFWQTIAQL